MFAEKLDEDAIISFQCICCGSCCRSGLDIFLNPMDIWVIRNATKKPTTHIKRQYLTFETRVEYGAYPFCVIKMRDNGYCPFLEDSLCSIHHYRPASCRFFPVIQFFDGERESAFALSPDIQDCPGQKAKKQYGLQGWLLVNRFMQYKDIIDFTPEIADVMMQPFDDDIVSPLFDIMYNFDKLDDFPFRDSYPMEGSSDDKFIKWLKKKVRAYLKSLDGF